MNTHAGASSTEQLDTALCVAFELADDTCGPGVFTAAAVACDVDLDDLWAHLAEGIDLWPRAAAAPDAPLHLARRWLVSDDPCIAVAASSHRGLCADELDQMINSWLSVGNLWPMRAALMNPNVNRATLVRFAHNPDAKVRDRVAQNPAAPLWVMWLYAKSACASTHESLTRNPATPPGILSHLAANGSRWIKRCVALHPRTPLEVLEELAAGPQTYANDAANVMLTKRRSESN